MHRLRVLSALLLLLPFLVVVRFGSPLQFHLLLSSAIFLCAWEFAWLCPVGADRRMAALTAIGSLGWQWSMISGLEPTVIGPIVVAGMLVRVLADGEELRAGVLRAAWTLLGVVYAGGLLGYGSLLQRSHLSRKDIFQQVRML